MPARGASRIGPVGGLRVNKRLLRAWSWRRHAALSGVSGLISLSVRCKGEKWYVARARARDAAATMLEMQFERDGVTLGQRAVRLNPAPTGELLGWVQTPVGCKAIRAQLGAAGLDSLELVPVTDSDPKSHPLASVPRWSAYQPPFDVRRIALPQALESLRADIDWADVQIASPPASREALARLTRGNAVVLDPAWCSGLKLAWRDVTALANDTWLIVDLETAARLLRAECKTWRDPHDIMSARIEYAGVPTRGFALQDVLPYSWVDESGRFLTRAIRASRDWKARAAKASIATLLSSETPWDSRCGDVLSAMRATEGGVLLITDLPWLAAGAFGPPLAPRLATALMRSHLGAPVADHVQHWNRTDEMQIVVRDLADLARRYEPLTAIRWRTGEDGIARLGVALVTDPSANGRRLLIHTGRIDALDPHNGLPFEPMAIFMKWLAREWREQTSWARRHLGGRVICWQFDAAFGHKYAVEFNSASTLGDAPTTRVSVRLGDACESPTSASIIRIPDEGIWGDGSLAFQETLTSQLRQAIERA